MTQKEFDNIDIEKLLDCIINGYNDTTVQQQIDEGVRQYLGRELSFDDSNGEIPDWRIFEKIRPQITVKYGYGVATDNTNQFYNANPSWKEAWKIGGHIKYQKHLEEEANYARLEKETNRTARWYESENAKKMFEDYPKTESRANWARILAWIAIGLTVIDILLKLIWHTPD